MRTQRQNKLLQNPETKNPREEKCRKHTNATVHVITKNSKIYDKVTVTIRGSYLLYVDEHILVVINKVK